MEKDNNKKKFNLKDIKPTNLAVIFLCGLALLVLSFPNLGNMFANSKEKKVVSNQGLETIPTNPESNKAETYTDTLEKKLEKSLALVEGIGKVEVMITLKSSKEIVTLKDSPYTQESMNEVDGEGGSRISSSIIKDDTTVLVNSGSGDNVPYVIKEIEPEISGVVVIAEGGEDAILKTEITEAVQVLFNVPVHKIKVMKMNK